MYTFLTNQEFSQRKKLSEGKEKLRRRHFQTEFKDTLRKLEVITELLANQKRQKRSESINIEARQDVVDAVVDAVEDTADVSAEVVEGAVDAVVDVVDDTADAVVDVADGAAEAAGGVVDGVADAADGVVDGAGDVVGAVGDLGETAGDLVGDLIGVLTDSTTGVIDTFTDVVQSVGDALQEVNISILFGNYITLTFDYNLVVLAKTFFYYYRTCHQVFGMQCV